MTEDKEKYLFDTYKELFEPEEYRNDETRSCMAFGFECNDGWYPLLNEALRKLKELQDNTICITQVKEKFGGLRLYYDGGSDEAGKIVDEAEVVAERTCEICGNPGKNEAWRHWYQTLCPKCREEMVKEFNSRIP